MSGTGTPSTTAVPSSTTSSATAATTVLVCRRSRKSNEADPGNHCIQGVETRSRPQAPAGVGVPVRVGGAADRRDAAAAGPDYPAYRPARNPVSVPVNQPDHDRSIQFL